MKALSWCSVLSLLTVLACHTSFAQSAETCRGKVTFDSTYTLSIHESLPVYHVHLIERNLTEDSVEEVPQWSYELHIQPATATAASQSLCGQSDSYFPGRRSAEFPGLEFVDLNFDGYTDLKMFNHRDVNGANTGYAVYLFLPDKRLFAFQETFSEVVSGTSVTIDSVNREIVRHVLLGCAGDCWSDETYRVRDGNLILVSSTTQEQEKDNPGSFVLVERKIVNGVLTVVSKQTVDPSHADK